MGLVCTTSGFNLHKKCHICCLSLLLSGRGHSAAPLLQAARKCLSAECVSPVGREINRDRLQSGEGWNGFTAGFLTGGLSGVAWAYILTQVSASQREYGCFCMPPDGWAQPYHVSTLP